MSESPIRATNPGEVLQLVPSLLGFTPEASLVVIAISNGVMEVTARMDLKDAAPPGGAEYLINRLWHRLPAADAAFVAVFTADSMLGWEVLHRCNAQLPIGVASTLLVVDDGHWQKADGTTGLARPGEKAAEAARRGLQPPLASRAKLEDSFTSARVTPALSAQIDAQIDALPKSHDITGYVEAMASCVRENLASAPTLSTAEAVRMALLTVSGVARDTALLGITPADAKQHKVLWKAVVNAVPHALAEFPLYLAGMAAWIGGDGAEAVIATERSLAVDPLRPGQRPARMLDQLITLVVRPTEWEPIRAALLSESPPAVQRAVTGRAVVDEWEQVPAPTPTKPEAPRKAPPAPGLAM